MAQAQEVSLPHATGDPVVLHFPHGSIGDDALTVFVKGAETPIAGRYAIANDTLSFIPAFGFEPGQDYVAKFGVGDKKQVTFRIPDDRIAVPASVTNVYPSGDTLPENTLRFYIHFSVPMQPQVAFDYIKLREASGSVDEAAFMRFKQELWNEDRTRLTVLIDPGRIKRDVATNVELGPALLAGQQYTLVVEDGWPTADGSTVLPAFTKTFQVSEALRSRPNTNRWSTNVPCVGTRDPLTVAFDRPFDRHLLMRSLRVEASERSLIGGQIDVAMAEHVWIFEPAQPWPADDLRLIADTTLEDVAGNNFHDLLDHIAGQEVSGTSSSELRISTRNCTG
ncbi:MAG: hypothetical protein OXQ30_06870 [Boseongicola sp.]|nr:hypothetical protein [Boseongicola sp.]